MKYNYIDALHQLAAMFAEGYIDVHEMLCMQDMLYYSK